MFYQILGKTNIIVLVSVLEKKKKWETIFLEKVKEKETKKHKSIDIIMFFFYMGVEASLIYCPIKPSIIRDIILHEKIIIIWYVRRKPYLP